MRDTHLPGEHVVPPAARRLDVGPRVPPDADHAHQVERDARPLQRHHAAHAPHGHVSPVVDGVSDADEPAVSTSDVLQHGCLRQKEPASDAASSLNQT